MLMTCAPPVAAARGGDLVARAGITVDRGRRAHPARRARESHRDVAGACTHIHTAPSGFEAEAFEGGCERPPDRGRCAVRGSPIPTTVLKVCRCVRTVRGYRCVVRVTMMLCDAAQVADGKLFILGGGWSLIGPDPMPSAIAIKVDVGWHEATRAHHWSFS